MKKFKVIALSVGGLRNKVYSAGEIVTENSFAEDSIKGLIKGGFIVEIEQKESKEEKKARLKAEAEKAE